MSNIINGVNSLYLGVYIYIHIRMQQFTKDAIILNWRKKGYIGVFIGKK